ncbi:MAG: phosphoribosylaminoimidazolesuccinocarboxamide synthase [Armatimonadetes bacterium]|nr:phosphoribosylaminoimidazolesuccinocarboxamide synthase [Armatimonadota bacterium]
MEDESEVIVLTTNIQGLPKFRTGKVRDVYDLGDKLLIVATDRISAFDVVMPNGIPDKGRVLTQLSLFWFDLTKNVVENHLLTADTDEILKVLESYGVADVESLRDLLDGRSMIVTKTKPFPVECVVRGYLSGSAWKEYKAGLQTAGDKFVDLHGHLLPSDLRESDKLPEPIFTPATKAETGHDLNISIQEMERMIGKTDADTLIKKTLAIYALAADYAASRGIIIADTKFEFGRLGDKIIVIDEVLTPDSSRFWDVNTYSPGGPQPSFDKQYVRDWLESIGWNKEPPPPVLPDDVVQKTAEKYREAYRRIVGKSLVPGA